MSKIDILVTEIEPSDYCKGVRVQINQEEFDIRTEDITYSDGGDNYLLDSEPFIEKIKDLVVFVITNTVRTGDKQ